jgi:flagellar basal-body rod protein FlgB
MTPAAPLLSTLENYLKLTTSREQTIAANMANVDTPGYRTQDINFQGEMNKAMNLATSPSGTFSESIAGDAGSLQNAQFSPIVQQVSGLLERPDGNNVSLDREGLLLAQSQLQYQVGVQLVKNHFHQLLSAISGGA